MALAPPQLRIAKLIYDTAVSRGVAPARARELVAAGIAESGLNPQATNPSSGAAGLFQLLSGGYRQRAQQLGGLYKPRANLLSILPDYQTYWRQHPGAAPGEAGRDVERSGMGSGFYSQPLAQVPPFGGGAAARPPSGANPASPLPPAGPAAPAQPDPRRILVAALMRASQTGNYGGFFSTFRALRQRPPATQPRPQPGAPPTAPPQPLAAPPRVPVAGYVNPYQGFTQGRTDQGVDFSGKGAVRALADATVVRLAPQGSGTGWPGAGGKGTGAMIVYRIDGGPQQGKFVYVAENVDPAAGLKVGSRLRAGQVIATARGYGPMLETGFSDAGGVPVSHGTYTEGKVTEGGRAFAALLRSLRSR